MFLEESVKDIQKDLEIEWCIETVITFIMENNFELECITLYDLTKLRPHWVRIQGPLTLKTSVAFISFLLLLSSSRFAFGCGKADLCPDLGEHVMYSGPTSIFYPMDHSDCRYGMELKLSLTEWTSFPLLRMLRQRCFFLLNIKKYVV